MQQVFKSFREMVAGQSGTPHGTMSASNSQVGDAFAEKIKPLLHTAAQAGDAFKTLKDALFGQFENHGIPFTQQSYQSLRKLNDKKRTLKSVAEQFPDVPKKAIQTLAKILAQNERPMLDLLKGYQNAHLTLVQEMDKQKDIYERHLPHGDRNLDTVYESLRQEVVAMDDDVRAGLKGRS
jgi:hypothetical protein